MKFTEVDLMAIAVYSWKPSLLTKERLFTWGQYHRASSSMFILARWSASLVTFPLGVQISITLLDSTWKYYNASVIIIFHFTIVQFAESILNFVLSVVPLIYCTKKNRLQLNFNYFNFSSSPVLKYNLKIEIKLIQ